MTSVENGKAPVEEFDEEIVEDDDGSYEEEVVDGEEDDESFEEEVVDDESGVAHESALADDSVAPQSEVALDSVQSTVHPEEYADFATFSPQGDEETGSPLKVVDRSPQPGMQFEIPQKPTPPSFQRGPLVDDMDPKPSSASPLCYWLVCLLICGLLGAGGYVGWFLVNEDQSDDPNLREGGTRAPTQAPTTALTTVFDPVQGDCTKLKSLTNPHPIDQCRCFGKIQKIAEDVVGRYQFHLETFVPTVYLEYPEKQGSCTARNQALMWLSSGNDYSFTLEERTERFALATLYAQLIGADWVVQDNWLSEESICSWNGVTCDDEGLLQILTLQDNKLVGRLPPEIALLKHMLQFFASNNEIAGPFPEGLFSITNLQLIDMSSNSLTGPIPPSIQYATSLKELNVRQNLLSGRITQLLGTVTSLESLSLGGNELVGSFPTEFFNLVNLTQLDIGGNQFTGSIPSEIALFTNLSSLTLGPNDFTGELPTSFVELVRLSSLVIRDIPLLEGRLPAVYAQQLKSLVELIITDTGIEGDIETSFGELPTLQRLELSNNKLRGSIPTELGNLDALRIMDLGSNFFTGSIPGALGTLGNLTRMLLNDNLLNGGVPDSFNTLGALEFLRLDGNSLTGRVSDEVCALRTNSLTSLIVDCPVTENGIDVGIICEIPSCCSGCRTSFGR